MKKGIALVAMLIAVLMLATGCNLIGHDAELDGAQVVAKVHDTEITKATWEAYRDYLAAYYQDYYRQNFGMNIQPTAEDMTAYGEAALEQLIENAVLTDKAAELGFEPLNEEDQKSVDDYADSMVSLYKMMLRYQNYPDVETVEEEQQRIEELTAQKAEAEQAVADKAAAEETAAAAKAAADEAAQKAAAAKEAADTAAAEVERLTAEAAEEQALAAAKQAAETAQAELEAAEADAAAAQTAADEAAAAAETEIADPEAIEIPEAVATMTDAELDELLTADLDTIGYTRDYFATSKTSELVQQHLRDTATEGVEVSDDEVKAHFDEHAAEEQERYDANPALYANNADKAYYVPAGYRGVKNLLIGLPEETSAQITELNKTLTTAKNTADNAQKQLDELAAEDTASFDEEAKAAYDEQVATLTAQVEENTAAAEDAQKQIDGLTEAAFAEILPTAEDVLARAKAGEDFDALVEEFGTDGGMKNEPAKSRGYLVCEGLTQFVPEFQDAAMALAQVGDVSELVKTTYGYHILQYAADIESGIVEFNDEIAEEIHAEMLEAAQDAAYEAAVTQWVSEAKPQTFPKVMGK